MSTGNDVRVWTGELLLPTYRPEAPDRNPMFLEKRVYQGSSGKVYPLPFTDRIAGEKSDRAWKAVWLENQYLRVLILPEIGGRIYSIQDKLSGADLIYNQPVIKPALVGLAGPWASGGIEFNWPQHHRPATFLPVDVRIEESPDGSKTVWCGDHDPMARMKGMHGVCLHPGRALLELRVRAYNRTPLAQTFLWWANAAIRVHEAYQSFFPPDVFYVADHARRAISQYPLCRGRYYGVDYAARGRQGVPAEERPWQFIPPHCLDGASARPARSRVTASLPRYAPNDLSFYANIPTPCSYMCMGSKEDFCGGYDYFSEVGLIHLANHHIAPGKKQWTWGNHPFGYSWDRNLTDPDAQGEYGPYIELMAGVYTDNQPDFSFLQPGETKAWSQFWYPIRKIGPAQHANLEAAVSLALEPRRFRLGISVTREFPGAAIRLERTGNRQTAAEWKADLAPGKPFLLDSPQARKPWRIGQTTLRVLDGAGHEIISYSPQPRRQGAIPPPADQPPPPREVPSADELFVTGLHLEQYRHATRDPAAYWREALRRDPLDCRCNNALGLWHLRRGEFEQAWLCFQRAIERLTRRNPNPYDGEPYYNLGLTLVWLDRADEAYAAFYKAAWSQAWTGPAYHALAELDGRRGDWAAALDHLGRSLRAGPENLRARDLQAVALRRLGRADEADRLLRETLVIDPLDWQARWLLGEPLSCDAQTRLDLAHDLARAGLYTEAISLLKGFHFAARDLPDQSLGAAPLLAYTVGWLHGKTGNDAEALACYKRAAAAPPAYCFPARLEEIAVLTAAMAANPRDARAPYYLGNLFYDRRRHKEAIRLWEKSARLDPSFSVVWRNLGIAYFNVSKNPGRSRRAYDKALAANPDDARLLFERDQLCKRLGDPPAKRLAELEKYPRLVRRRDDLCLELCALYNQTGRHEKACEILAARKFQPWEGGEGLALGQHVRTRLALGRTALAAGDAARAASHFHLALQSPENLGEARHLLANQSDAHYWLGSALAAAGEKARAREHWRAAADFRGDFQEMSCRSFSEMTYYSALAWRRLGRKARAAKLFRDLLAYARRLRRAPAAIDYFATSLPAMLLFEDDLPFRQETAALFLQAQAQLGLGAVRASEKLLTEVLRRDPNHAPAADLRAELALPRFCQPSG
ncbi:MAG: DUF5107 domain-containing protein [Verrucomicrobiota bacterium]|jgi:tetratricopeptide (TPR) repeat protein